MKLKRKKKEYYDEEEQKTETKLPKERKIKRIINIIFIIIIIIMVMITVDVISVSRYNKGPFFAIKTTTYKDGGTRIYYGFGYKVIKYHQTQGRRDTKIGFWSMPYVVEPTTISSLDFALELRNNPEKTYKKFVGEFIRTEGVLTNIDKEKNTITLKYTDTEGGEYNLKISCKMADKKNNISKLKISNDVTVIGTVKDIKFKSKNTPNTLYINDCFAE